MNSGFDRFRRGLLPISCALFSAASFCILPRSAAQSFTLTNGNSSVDIFPTSQGGMATWKVDGVNQLSRQWFWCRDGPYEYSLDSLKAQPPLLVQNAANELTTLHYDESNYTFGVHYTLTGGAAGSGTSSMLENVSIHNAAATSLILHVFQYADFDLAGTSGDDTVTLLKDGSNRFYQAVQTDPTGVTSTTTVSITADHGEANFYSATLTKLNDYYATTLNDNAGPLGPGDATWALEWDFNIAAGGTVNLDILKQIAVPEPSTATALGAGLLVWTIRRRVRR